MSRQSGESSASSEFLATGLLIIVAVLSIWFVGKPYLIKFFFWATPTLFKAVITYCPHFFFTEHDRLLMADVVIKLRSLKVAEVVDGKAVHFVSLMMELYGKIFRIILIPIITALSIWWYLDTPSRMKYRYRITLRQLAMQHIDQFPCVLPAIKADLLNKDQYIGKWKVPLSPIEFAVKHRLLVYKSGSPNEKRIEPLGVAFNRLPPKAKRKKLPDYQYITFDKKACDEVMRKQLGEHWRGIDALPPLERALAACFMGAALGGAKNKEARKFLDQISRTFEEAAEDKDGNILGESKADLTGIDEFVASVIKDPRIKPLIRGHAFVKTVFIRLLDRRHGGARAKGKLTPTDFHWLKPHNEDLWRTLHPVGGQTPWVEGVAPWIHYELEIRLKRAIPDPIVESATDSINKMLHEEQWIMDKELREQDEYEAAQLLELVNRMGATKTNA